MMTAIRGVKFTARAVAIIAGISAAWQAAGAGWMGATILLTVSVLMAYLGWVVVPAQEDLQRILGRLHEFDNRPRQANDRYGWETRR